MTRLASKIALITGAANGIGRDSALRMAQEGGSIVCADLDEAGAARTAAMIDQQGGRAMGLALDVGDSNAVQDALQTTLSQFGGLHVLFNNAGIALGDVDWDTIIRVNLTGVKNGLEHAAPLMAEQGGGVILNTASVAGLGGLVGAPADPTEQDNDEDNQSSNVGAYVASKHGVVGLTRQFAVAYGSLGVRVNAIAPGYIETAMTAEMRETQEGKDFLISLHPMGRLGQPAEIAAVAAFLASEDASFINGAVIPVDGGYTAR